MCNREISSRRIDWSFPLSSTIIRGRSPGEGGVVPPPPPDRPRYEKCPDRARVKRAWRHRSDLNVAGETVTVIQRRCIAVLKRFLRAPNSKCAGTLNQQSFREDFRRLTHKHPVITWPGCRTVSMGVFFFSLCASVSWPPRSPDFTAPYFSCGVPEEYCAPRGTRKLGNFETGDPCGHSRDLPSLMFGRGGQTPSNAVWPRNTDTSSTCHSESHELAAES